MDRGTVELIAGSCLMGIRFGGNGLALLSEENVTEIQAHIADAILAVQREMVKKCLAAINSCAWRHLHKRDAVEVLEVREALLALIEKRRE